MAITYREVEAGGTRTDASLTVSNMDLLLNLTYYESGLHQIHRPAQDPEYITLSADTDYDTQVTVYLLDDPEYGDQDRTVQVAVWKTDAKGQQYLEYDTETVTDHNMLLRNEGLFTVDSCRVGLDSPYQPEDGKLAMLLTSFTIPKGFTGKLTDLNINVIQVVDNNG